MMTILSNIEIHTFAVLSSDSIHDLDVVHSYVA